MLRMNVHLKSGKVRTIHFHVRQEAWDILISYSDWVATGPDSADATQIDVAEGGQQRVVIPFTGIEYLEIE